MKELPLLLAGMVLVLSLSACAASAAQPGTAAPETAPTVSPEPTAEAVPTPTPTPEPTPTVITLTLAGDLVMHTPLNAEARTTDGGYDYAPLFEDVAHYVSDADFALCCSETVFTGSGSYTGYPLFHSPDELAYSLKDVGFDLINTASNHAMDGRQSGLIRTLDTLDEAGLDYVGTYRTQEERDVDSGIVVEEIDGVTIAFLDYTYGTNGFSIAGIEYSLNVYYIDYLDWFNKINYDMIDADMATARALGTDLIAVTVHWGGEYVTDATQQQRDFADYLFAQGADLVIGGHPHVPEPMSLRKITDADGTERIGFVCYCLGNLLSSMNETYTDLSAMVRLEITKDPATGTARITDCGYIPMVMVDLQDYGTYGAGWRFRLWDLREAIADYEAGDDRGVMTDYMYTSFKKDLESCRRIFGILEAPVEG